MRYCPRCQQSYSEKTRFCTVDGESLMMQDPYHLVGRTIDKYRIEEIAGIGGLGAVYRAHQLGIERRVAFKILQPNVANQHTISLFEREARMAGSLSHENIVVVYDSGCSPEGISYMAMEWLEGQTLEDEISKAGQISFERITQLLIQITAALEEAHSRHIIHRDLKPSNIMILKRPGGRDLVKVLDFGIGKILGDTAGSPVSQIVGTPHYASPEQFQPGGVIDYRADIYSLGVILYQLLTGSLPFETSSIHELIQMHLTAPPPEMRTLRPDAPPEMERLVRKMMAKDYKHRPYHIGDIPFLFDAALHMRRPPSAEFYSDEAPGSEPSISAPAPPMQFSIPDLQVSEFEVITLDDAGKILNQHQSNARSFIEDFPDGITLEMIEIPGGNFLMGSPENEKGRFNGEGPQHLVNVSPFFMGRFEITQSQWRSIARQPSIRRDLTADPARNRGDQHPVEYISWEEAEEFCARLSQATGRPYRLPSEAEWEYACRAGTATPYHFGETIIPELVNHMGRNTVPVGSLNSVNAFGLSDMHGNVWEWCADIWHYTYRDAPADARVWNTIDKRTEPAYCVARGGSFLYQASVCRSAYRLRVKANSRNNNIGLRVALSKA